jgi:hypothetical protein
MNYLLPCKACGTELAVSTGQAGQTLHCRCGATIDVPSIRELRNLPAAEREVASGPTWGSRQGLLFVGGAIAGVALIGIAVLWLMRPALVDIRAEIGEPDLATLQKEVKSVSLDEGYMRYESIRPWPPQLFAEKKEEEVPPYLIASQELIKAFESGGTQFLTPYSARPILEKIQLRSNENLIALHTRKQLKDWTVILGVGGGIGLAIAVAGLLVPTENAGARAAKRKRVPQTSR